MTKAIKEFLSDFGVKTTPETKYALRASLVVALLVTALVLWRRRK